MGLFDKIFNKKTSDSTKKPIQDPSQDPNMIKVFDSYGREFYITKQEWKDNILIGNLENARNNPDDLYQLLVSALNDGFAKDVVKYAEVLQQIDKIPSRGATVLSIVYMDFNRLDDAEKVLTDCIEKNGEDGVVLTNLAKVYSRREDHEKAESTLWHALEIDPNQENGLGWYAAVHNDRGGEPAYLEAYRRVTELPQSWRAQLWLARFALEKKDIDAAKKLYEESISRAGNPIPADLLMQMSGDLGNNGYLKEIIEFVEPNFDPSFHGILVGNNLIKTHFDLSQLDSARSILDQLYSQRRLDWRDTLSYWDTELAKKVISIKSEEAAEIPAVAIVSIEGPLWCRDKSPFAMLLPPKTGNSIKIAFFGNTTIQNFSSNKPSVQLADSIGRASRAIPLLLAEKLHINTNATGFALIAWAQTKGFAVFGKPYDEKSLCEFAEKSDAAPDFIISVILDSTELNWGINVNIISRIDRKSHEKINITVLPENLGPTVLELGRNITKLLVKYAGIELNHTPEWYTIPDGVAGSDYLLRLEQQLAVVCKNLDFLQGGGLQGEHEIIDGILHLNVEFPNNKTIRMLFAQTLIQMRKYNSKIVEEYRDKIMLLQREHPLEGDDGQLIQKTISEIF